jgi:hypothetical protein
MSVSDEWINQLRNGRRVKFESTYHVDGDYTLISGRYDSDPRLSHLTRRPGQLTREQAEIEWSVERMSDSEAKARYEQLKPTCGDPHPLMDGVAPDAIPVETLQEYQSLAKRLFPNAATQT